MKPQAIRYPRPARHMDRLIYLGMARRREPLGVQLLAWTGVVLLSCLSLFLLVVGLYWLVWGLGAVLRWWLA